MTAGRQRVQIGSSASGLALPELVKRYRADAAAAVKAGVEGAQVGMVEEMRREIAGAFPNSRRLPTAITGDTYPEATVSLDAAAWVRPRNAKVGAMLATFVDGATIRPRMGGTVLAVPTAAVPRVFGRKMTPEECRRRFGRSLDLVPPRPGSGSAAWGALVLRQAYLSGKAGRVRQATARTKRERIKSVVLFILIPEAQMPKRLAPEAIAEQWASRVPSLIERAALRLGV